MQMFDNTWPDDERVVIANWADVRCSLNYINEIPQYCSVNVDGHIEHFDYENYPWCFKTLEGLLLENREVQ